jgi:hypothetical protein
MILPCTRPDRRGLNVKSTRARNSVRFAAIVVGLATVLAGAPGAVAEGPPPFPPTPPNASKLEGQLKNGYNKLCLTDANTKKLGTMIRYAKCTTVNGGYTSADQYFYLSGDAYGVEIVTLRRTCVAVRRGGNPKKGDLLVTKKCNPADPTTQFITAGGDDGVPYYWTAETPKYKATSMAIGFKTKSAGAGVRLFPNSRDSAQAWHGSLLDTD